MKYNDIPIVILSRDRFYPLKKQVEILISRGFENIHIIDNQSTYKPLLDWFDIVKNDINVFHNKEVANSNKAFVELSNKGIEPFNTICKDWYIFNDNDIILEDSVPEDFVQNMIYVAQKYNKTKIGFSIRIDDIDLTNPLNEWVYSYEKNYWTNGIFDHTLQSELYPHPIDTTFAIHSPNTPPTWSNNTLRMGYPYIVRHLPFYYDPNNLPEDEKYYIEHMNKQSSNWSSKVRLK